MSLRSPLGYALPEATARIARAAFPKGNPYLRLADTLGPIFRNPEFADLSPTAGQPAEDPAQVALVTIFQFAESLTDRQAADAVRRRIDWKYALCLPLDDDGFDHTVLCEFRARLIAGNAELRLFETVLTSLKEQGFVTARGRQRTDSTHVLAAIHVLNRLECVGETLRHTLNVLAVAAPAWLRGWVPPAWFDRYEARLQDYRLPKGKDERAALAAQIGADGRHLLAQLDDPAAPAGLSQLPAVRGLRRGWLQQYDADEPVRWRAAADLPPGAVLISTPYDAEARFSVKPETIWTGYKVHLTETCDEDRPNLITDVATAPATETDYEATAGIHDRLAKRDLLPGEYLVDTAYVTAEHLVTSRADHGVDLVGPDWPDPSWQARQQTGDAVAQFAIDWAAQQATWRPSQSGGCWATGQSPHPMARCQTQRTAAPHADREWLPALPDRLHLARVAAGPPDCDGLQSLAGPDVLRVRMGIRRAEHGGGSAGTGKTTATTEANRMSATSRCHRTLLVHLDHVRDHGFVGGPFVGCAGGPLP